MADYPMTSPSTSTPSQQLQQMQELHESLQRPLIPDPLAIQHMLATLERIPRAELPTDADRNALRWLIERGYVDNLYTPVGANYHNIAWAHRPDWCDPRERVCDWLAACRAYYNTGELDPLRKELADAER